MPRVGKCEQFGEGCDKGEQKVTESIGTFGLWTHLHEPAFASPSARHFKRIQRGNETGGRLNPMKKECNLST